MAMFEYDGGRWWNRLTSSSANWGFSFDALAPLPFIVRAFPTVMMVMVMVIREVDFDACASSSSHNLFAVM